MHVLSGGTMGGPPLSQVIQAFFCMLLCVLVWDTVEWGGEITLFTALEAGKSKITVLADLVSVESPLYG